MSSRNCPYPQIIILQFSRVITIRQIQFLSHQYNISSKIELYSYSSIPEEYLNNNETGITEILNLKFNKIGFFTMDSNESTGYATKELKSVFLNVPSLFLKIALYKNYENQLNKYNQVGLYSINCFSETGSSSNQIIDYGYYGIHQKEEKQIRKY